MRFINHIPLFLLSCLFFSNLSTAQKQLEKEVPFSKALYDSIAHMDSVLFNAFNNRDLATIKTVFSKDMEFFHDKGGLTNYTQNIGYMVENFKKNNGLNRKLVPGSMEVYSIKDYGAIQIGRHIFCHMENGKEECGTFKFVHVWKSENGWKLTRIISYDH